MRTYKKKVDLDRKKVKDFFKGREKRFEADPITAVLYQDNNPTLAHERDAYEKSKITPLLNLKEIDHILDVGCGIGRWVDVVSKVGSSYIGIDFEKSFISFAKEKYKGFKNIEFKVLDALSISPSKLGEKKFDKVLIAGLLLYLNDSDVREFFDKLRKVVHKDSIIYLREPVGIDKRLSLEDIWSDDLNQRYSAIYRTREELLELIGSVEIITEGDMYHGKLNNRSDTKQYYFLLKIL